MITKLIKIGLKKILLSSALVLLVSLPLMLIAVYYPVSFDKLVASVNKHDVLLGVARWSIVLLFILFWPPLVGWIGKHYQTPIEKNNYWKNETYRIAIWLILFELLICENIILKLFHSI